MLNTLSNKVFNHIFKETFALHDDTNKLLTQISIAKSFV